jgi:predicted transcriptional regulator of viral defense system
MRQNEEFGLCADRRARILPGDQLQPNYFFDIRKGMKVPSSRVQKLLTAIVGPVRTRDLVSLGVNKGDLPWFCAMGFLTQVDRGLYRLTERERSVSQYGRLAEVAIRAPRSKICLLSAAQYHGLGAEVPQAVWVMLGFGVPSPKIVSPQIEVVRARGAAFNHGVQEILVEGVQVQITTPAKTVADCFRFRHHVGLEAAMAVLRDYLRLHRAGTDALVEAAKACRVRALITPYIEAAL